MYMTLDGYGEFPKYPGSDVPRKEPSERFIDMWINRYDSVDTILYGRRSYEGHVAVHKTEHIFGSVELCGLPAVVRAQADRRR